MKAYDRVWVSEQSETFQYDRFVSGSDRSVSSHDTDTDPIETCLLRKGRSSRVDAFFKILVRSYRHRRRLSSLVY